MKPYGLISDLHCHDWSAFSSLDSEGRNTRLMSILNEVDRCCVEVKKLGGDKVLIAGDMFHTRGSVDPSVYNPTKDAFEKWRGKISFVGIAGNHDLKSKESIELGSSVNMLKSDNVHFHHKKAYGAYFCMVPWISSPDVYKDEICSAKVNIGDCSNVDLICHVGIDGTLATMPDHGVDASWFASLGFRRVFSGHYHNYKDFGNGVYSIGATTHQTWSDVGTKAGFMIVHQDHTQWFASHAPSFIELDGTEDPEELELIVDGHFVKAKLGACDLSAIKEMRELLFKLGAKGVIVDAQKSSSTASRTGITTKSISAIDKSVSSYVIEKGMSTNVSKLCLDILKEAQAS
jgi:DNA repair exonuclease SbcCD nuclease subunit